MDKGYVQVFHLKFASTAEAALQTVDWPAYTLGAYFLLFLSSFFYSHCRLWHTDCFRFVRA